MLFRSLLIAFIGLVVGLAVGRQRNEVAVLRSRGASVGQIAGISGLEALMLGLFALLVAVPLSYLIAQVIGATRSFLNFTGEANLRLTFNQSAINAGMIALGITFMAQVLPTFGAARHTIVTYKQEQARALRPPWWQRMWLDVLLLVPAGYGLYLLRQQGSIAIGGRITSGESIFENPLHPYTQGLFSSRPEPGKAKTERLSSIRGMVPSPLRFPPGCKFHPRCNYVQDNCKVDEPVLRELQPGHWVRCHYAEEIKVGALKAVIPTGTS